MSQINAQNFPPRGGDLHAATALTADTLALDDVNSADYQAYTQGGFLIYNTPVSLAGMTAEMVIRDAPLTGTVLATLTSTAGIVLDDAAKTITARLDTAALTWTVGYYTLELTDTATGKVVQLLSGVLNVR
ncbi:MAG: hypothetical protein ACYC36_02330 [Bellilinea sp.]